MIDGMEAENIGWVIKHDYAHPQQHINTMCCSVNHPTGHLSSRGSL